jgi:hypothetical protein
MNEPINPIRSSLRGWHVGNWAIGSDFTDMGRIARTSAVAGLIGGLGYLGVGNRSRTGSQRFMRGFGYGALAGAALKLPFVMLGR